MALAVRAAFVTLLVVAMLVAGSAAAWLVARDRDDGRQAPTAESIQTAMAEEAAKPRFTGRLGDFLVTDSAAEADIFCATTPVPLSDALRGEELWSDAFGEHGIGWACPGEGVSMINNEGPTGEGSEGQTYHAARGYFRLIPLPILTDAPRDRYELITVEGHPALLERPVPGYPYGQANLVVIERYPDGDGPGIVVWIRLAPSAEDAIARAEEIIP